MKTKITMLLAMICALSVSAQDNNRMNEIGKQFLPSVNIIKADVENGKVTAINQEAIDLYLKSVPIKAEMNVKLASELFNLKKAGQINLKDFVQNTGGVSEACKTLTLKIATSQAGVSKKAVQVFHTNLVTEIEKSKLPAAEKDLLLAYNAVAYNVRIGGVNEISSLNGEAGDCLVTGPDGSAVLTPTECVIAAATVGFYIGFQACGVWCGVGGAVVFAVVTAISVC